MKTQKAAQVAGRDFTNKPRRDKKNDLYETPWSMVHQLMDRESFFGSGLEPASGKGAIVLAVKNWFHCSKPEREFAKITSYDLGDGELFGGVDFMKEDRHFDYIITNPPFSQSIEFVTKALKVADKVAMLLPLDYLHGQKRFRALWNRPRSASEPALARVYAFVRKPNLRDAPRPDGRYRTGAMAYAWYVWEKTPRPINTGLHWIDNNAWVDHTAREGDE